MIEIEFNIPNIEDTNAVIARVESVLRRHRLKCRSRGTLKSYPGCVHWHWTRGSHAGTLEVTLWPTKRRMWFKVQAGRRADWIDRTLPRLKAELESAKRGTKGRGRRVS